MERIRQKSLLHISLFIFMMIIVSQLFALAGSEQASGLLQQHTDDTVKVQRLYKMADSLAHSNLQNAVGYAEAALELSDSLGFIRGKIESHNSLGQIYLDKADYKTALRHFINALRLCDASGNNPRKALLLNNMGIIYYRMKRYDVAKGCYFQARSLIAKYGLDKRQLSVVYVNLGNLTLAQHNLKGSIFYYERSYEIAKEVNLPRHMCVALMSIGERYLDLDQLDKAAGFFDKALKVLEGNDQYPYYVAASHYALGKIALKHKQAGPAETHFLKTLEILEKTGIKGLLFIEIHEYLAAVYKQKNDYRTAMKYYQAFHALRDSSFNETNARQINEMEARYEVEKKDQQIELLNKDKQVVEAMANRQRLLRNSFIGAFVLIFLVCVVIARNMYLKQQVNAILNDKNTQLAAKNELLNEQNLMIEEQKNEIEEKNNALDQHNKQLLVENISAKYETLKSKTNPHFLFNSMSTLSAIVIEEPHLALEFISRFSELYRMILETDDDELIPLQKELNIVEHYLYLQKMRFDSNMIVHIMPLPDASRYSVPPFAMQMVVENAIKHNIISDDEQLTINIYSEDNYLVIKNNLQRKTTGTVSTRTGQKSIKERYNLLSSIQPVFLETKEHYIVKLPLLTVKAPVLI